MLVIKKTLLSTFNEKSSKGEEVSLPLSVSARPSVRGPEVPSLFPRCYLKSFFLLFSRFLVALTNFRYR